MNVDDSSEVRELWSLAEDVLVEADQDGPIVVVSRWGEHKLSKPSPLMREALHRMSLGPVSLANLISDGQNVADTSLARQLDEVSHCVIRSLALSDGRGPLLSLVPARPRPEFRPLPAGGREVSLSKYAAQYAEAGSLWLTSPIAPYRANLHQPLVRTIVSALARPMTSAAVAKEVDASPAVVGAVLTYLVAAGVVLRTDAAEEITEDADALDAHWTRHELSFHMSSRSRQLEDVAASKVRHPVRAPAVRRPPAGPRFPLYRPNMSRLMETDPSLTRLLELDHHCPAFTERDLPAENVGELLFRSARVRGPGPAVLPLGMDHDSTQRPYVNMACLYELEVYVTIGRSQGLPNGIFHYDPQDHALTLVNDRDHDIEWMLESATVAAACVRRPPVLFTVTCRRDRTTVLGSDAYASTLLHFGALQQTIYLVARSMNLAVHTIRMDTVDQVDRALGLYRTNEVSVGECTVDYAE